jgi:hypothetical protein
MQKWAINSMSLRNLLLLLVFFSALFCHRIYSTFFLLEGDAVQNVYFWANSYLVNTGYDENLRDYFPLMSMNGYSNPIYSIFKTIGEYVGPNDIYYRAIILNMVLGFLELVTLSLSAYFIVRKITHDNLIAIASSVIVTFTGFHLVSVREFDHPYIISYTSAILLIYNLVSLIALEKYKIEKVLASIILISLGLLAGTNVPTFYFFLPICLLPIIDFKYTKNINKIFSDYALLIFIFAGALIISGGVIGEGIEQIDSINRQSLTLTGSHSIRSLFNGLISKDWIFMKDIHFHERDNYLGLPVIFLFITGFMGWINSTKNIALANDEFEKLKRIFEYFLIACIINAIIVSIFIDHLGFFGNILKKFYELQSIRLPKRFQMLAGLGIAYFSAIGIHKLNKKNYKYSVYALLVAITVYALIFSKNLPRELSDGALLSVLFQILALCIIALISYRVELKKALSLVLVTFIYASYLFSQNIFTAYTNPFYSNNFQEYVEKNLGAYKLIKNLGSLNYERVIEFAKRKFFDISYIANKNQCTTIYDTTNSLNHFIDPSIGIKYVLANIDDPFTNIYLSRLYDSVGASLYPALGVDCIARIQKNKTQYGIPLTQTNINYNSNVIERIEFSRPSINRKTPKFYFTPTTYIEKNQHSLEKEIDNKDYSFLKNLDYLSSEKLNHRQNHRQLKGFFDSTTSKYTGTIMPGEAGYILINIPYHRRWRAFVDNHEVIIFKANYAFMAVEIQSAQGIQKIEINFDRSYYKSYRSLSYAILFLLILALFILSLTNSQKTQSNM